MAAKVTPTKPAAPPAKPAAPAAKPPAPPTKVKPPADDPDPAAANEGILLLSAKPPCEILIDGKPTGLVTPQREIILSVGSHRITLVNAEYSINETFTVDIRADAPAKLIKNFLTKE